MSRLRVIGLLAGAAVLVHAHGAIAQSAAAASGRPVPAPNPGPVLPNEVAGVGEIVVTAQKRAQSINAVGLTITAATANTLLERGVTSTADLAKIAPGFTYTQSPYATPVYTLRGIGLYDYSLGSAPSVAIYVDEFSLPFPVMTEGATLDLERVEILKGPQGTLFGESATGGAINYIAAKPTSTFKAGVDGSFERFGKADVSGFISGPVTDTLKARLALRTVEGGAWQYSVTRPNDKNGASDQLYGRLLLDFDPSERLAIHLNLNGWRDKSDTQQAQFTSNQLNLRPAADPRDPYAKIDPAGYAALTTPGSSSYDPSFIGRQNTVLNRAANGEVGELLYLAGPNGDGSAVANDPRKAEWTPGYPTSSNDYYYQAALRIDFKITPDVTLSSLSAYEHTKIDRYFDNDATTAAALDERLHGSIDNVSQELRLTGTGKRFNWIVGGNYEHSKIDDHIVYNIDEVSLNEALPGLRFSALDAGIRQKLNTYAGFANGEFKLTDKLTVLGGARYTESDRHAANCSIDLTASQILSKTFGNADVVPGFGFYDLQTAFGLNPAGHVVVQPGQCYELNDSVAPTNPGYLRPAITPFEQTLNEHNVSFRAGTNYKFDQGTLLYATISQGYKAGIISGISPSTTSQYVPAKQEKLVAYEAGFKVPLADHLVQVNGAGFYYDYSNKQVRARVRDNIFGLLETLVNVPKSRIWGVEGEVVARPVAGLDLSLSGTYLNSKVTRSFSTVPNATGGSRPLYNQEGYTGDVKGSELPYTPKFSGVFDGQYQFPVAADKKAFFGTTITYQSRDNTTFHNAVVLAPDYFRRAHTLVDLRAGIAGEDGAWRVTAYARNVFNTYYETTIFAGTDTLYRYAGRPATYGLAVSLRTK